LGGVDANVLFARVPLVVKALALSSSASISIVWNSGVEAIADFEFVILFGREERVPVLCSVKDGVDVIGQAWPVCFSE
jgi:hypothetical protein